MARQHFLRFPFIVSLCLVSTFLTSCDSPRNHTTSDAAPRASAAPPADSPAERTRLAHEIVTLHPTATFLEELRGRIVSVAGREVGADVERRLLERFDLRSLEAQRIGLFEAHFTAEELQELVRLYQSSAGKSLLRKLPTYEEGWRSFLSPIIIAELSGQR